MLAEESTLIYQQLLIGETLKAAAHSSPNRTAFVYGNEQLTFQQLLDRAGKLSGWLQEQGIQKDDKIGCIFKNGMAFVELYFGVTVNGAVFVPVNFRLTAGEMQYILDNADVKILFIEEEYLEIAREIVPKLPKVEKVIVVGSSDNFDTDSKWLSYETVFNAKAYYRETDYTDDDDHMIIYTSGTTGKPKGAVLSHKNCYMNSLNSLYHSPSIRGTKMLLVTPLFHISGLCFLSQTCITEGTIYIHRDFNPVNILQTIQAEKINSIVLVPTMWNFLFQVPNIEDYDVSSVVKCGVGGAICPLELKKRILQVFKNGGIHEAFGQTEMSPTTTYLTGEDALRKTASVGKPSINVRVRIVDENMNDVPQGEVGEIIYRGPTMMKRYYNNPQATEEAFKGGWFHSGDLVQMDEEGYIYVIDRKNDMIISGGENIYPKEIEEVLYTHPDILEAAIVGIPDPNWGESVKAFVVMKPGKQLTEEEVIQYCGQHISSYKKPRFVEFINVLPRNASGKILKTELRKLEAST